MVNKVAEIFKMGKRMSNAFRYVGIDIDRNTEGISVKQDQYGEEIVMPDVEIKNRHDEDTLEKSEVKELRKLSGKLLWFAGCTRPDLNFDAIEVSMIVQKKEPMCIQLKD